MRGSVAVVPVHGALGKGLTEADKQFFGMADYLDVEDAMLAAAADPDVSHILMHVDSPGGTVVGLPETAAKIRDIEKPVTAYTEGIINTIDTTVEVGYNGNTAVFERQIFTNDMSDPGDSGSLIVNEDNRAVGLLFAGSSTVTVLNPIDAVLSALNITI